MHTPAHLGSGYWHEAKHERYSVSGTRGVLWDTQWTFLGAGRLKLSPRIHHLVVVISLMCAQRDRGEGGEGRRGGGKVGGEKVGGKEGRWRERGGRERREYSES